LLKFKHYIKDEQSDWITFVHGAGGSSTVWHKQVKFLKNHFNLLLIDLRGHGMSNDLHIESTFSLEQVVDEIVEVTQYLGLKRSHFIGVSLGSIIISKLSERHPEMVNKIVLSGAITSFTFRTLFLLRTVQIIKSFLPNIVLYKLFAWIIMPKKNHQLSRQIFIKEAQKIKHKAFRKWLKLIPEIKSNIDTISQFDIKHSVLFISGQEDYLFVRQIECFVKNRPYCIFKKINGSGHIVNIDQHQRFNEYTLNFLK